MTLLTPQDIASLFQMELRNVRPLLRQPGFPPPAIDLSRKIRRWNKDTIEQWLHQQERKNSR